MASRKIDQCIPELQEKFKLFAVKMAEAGLPFMLTCTFRSQDEQNDLYAQGRTKPGKKVTWTRHSKHQEGRAFDIAILSDGKPTWDVKVDVNADDEADYLQAAIIGRNVGLTPGAFWSTPDYPHYEV